MAHNHGFHIPDESYCKNIPGLLSQIAQDISLGNICITCGHGFGGLVTGEESDADLVRRARKGLDAVRAHMTSKSHTRLRWDTEEQRLRYSDHYDYRSSYPDYVPGEDDEDDLSTPEMEVDEADGEDWEDASDEDIDENDQVVMDYSAVRRKIRKPMEDDLDYRLAVAHGDYELILPSGARVGHRALKGVYKQNVMREFRRRRRLQVMLMPKSSLHRSLGAERQAVPTHSRARSESCKERSFIICFGSKQQWLFAASQEQRRSEICTQSYPRIR